MTESWFGESRKKLFDLIGKYKKNGVILLSGDIHCAQFYKTFCVIPGIIKFYLEIGYPIYEASSSGLSHHCFYDFFADYIFSNRYSINPMLSTFNFANVELIWGKSRKSSFAKIYIVDIENVVRDELTLSYSDLSYNEKYKNDTECYANINSRFRSLKGYATYYMKRPLEALMMFLVYLIFFLSIYVMLKIFLIIKVVILSLLYPLFYLKRKLKGE